MAKVASSEPVGAKINASESDYRINLVMALNWYNTEKDKKDAKQYLAEYASKNKIKATITESTVLRTYGWLARIIDRGGMLAPADQERLDTYLQSLVVVQTVAVVADTPQAPKVSVQDLMKQKINEYLGDLDLVVDDAFDNIYGFNLLNDLKAKQMPQQTAPAIIEWCKRQLKEMIPAYDGSDKYYEEAYSNVTKLHLKKIIKMFSGFIDDAEKYGDFKKANRKPRATKAKPAGQQVKDLKFLKKCDELGIESCSATEIIGAQQVWLFNTKTRKLMLYKTDSAKGIQVKGTTLQNYDPEVSLQKTLRKPAEQIKALMAAGKVQLRKYMDNIKATAGKVTGRVNADTLILRVV